MPFALLFVGLIFIRRHIMLWRDEIAYIYVEIACDPKDIYEVNAVILGVAHPRHALRGHVIRSRKIDAAARSAVK